MSAAGTGATNPASVASSASTIITVGTPGAEEDDLYAAVRASMRRPRTGLPRPDAASTEPSSTPGSPLGGGARRNGSTASDASTSTGENLVFEPEAVKQSASMSSSVRAHVYEGGMRYHAFRNGKYALPNDEAEQNRDDMKHSLALMLCHGAHFLAPVEETLRAGGEILDLGMLMLFAL